MASATYPLSSETSTAVEESGTDTAIGSGLTDSDGAAAGKVLDHCVDGTSKLIQQFKNKPRIKQWLCSYLRRAQDLEDALWQLYTERVLDAAVGIQLDKAGALVGEDRKGKADADYRQFIKARIKVNNSDGRLEDLLDILHLLLGSTYTADVSEYYPAAIHIRFDDSAFPLPRNAVRYMLRKAKGGGVRLLLEFLHLDPSATFTMRSDHATTEYDTDTGFASAAGHPAGAGGGFSSAVE